MNSVKEKTGQVFSIARDNAPVAGCTISKEVYNGENSITYFSLYRRKFTSRPRLGNYFNPWDRKDNSTLMAQLLVLRKLSNSLEIENMIQSFQTVFTLNKNISPKSYGLPNNWDFVLRNIR